MANVVQPPFDFQLRTPGHNASPFGFGFGLSNPPTAHPPVWQPLATQTSTQASAFNHLTNTLSATASSSRPQKRRQEFDDDSSRFSGEEPMDRSPTPERPKRAVPKRVRMFNAAEQQSKAGKGKEAAPCAEDDVDVGVLLATLPPQSLLPLLMELLRSQPLLKTTILPLIPRPTLSTAIQTLATASRKLLDAYPYSSVSPSMASSPAFNSPTDATPSSSAFPRSSIGFGAFAQQWPMANHPSSSAGMREEYVISRVRPHIAEFVSACMSYMPYFTQVVQLPANTQPTGDSPHATLHSANKPKCPPAETFQLLSAIVRHILDQPTLTQTSLIPDILPRLRTEWLAWVEQVDTVANREGGMFGHDTAQAWSQGLDELAFAKNPTCAEVMGDVRDHWVKKVGWLVGRSAPNTMNFR